MNKPTKYEGAIYDEIVSSLYCYLRRNMINQAIHFAGKIVQTYSYDVLKTRLISFIIENMSGSRILDEVTNIDNNSSDFISLILKLSKIKKNNISINKPFILAVRKDSFEYPIPEYLETLETGKMTDDKIFNEIFTRTWDKETLFILMTGFLGALRKNNIKCALKYIAYAAALEDIPTSYSFNLKEWITKTYKAPKNIPSKLNKFTSMLWFPLIKFCEENTKTKKITRELFYHIINCYKLDMGNQSEQSSMLAYAVINLSTGEDLKPLLVDLPNENMKKYFLTKKNLFYIPYYAKSIKKRSFIFGDIGDAEDILSDDGKKIPSEILLNNSNRDSGKTKFKISKSSFIYDIVYHIPPDMASHKDEDKYYKGKMKKISYELEGSVRTDLRTIIRDKIIGFEMKLFKFKNIVIVPMMTICTNVKYSDKQVIKNKDLYGLHNISRSFKINDEVLYRNTKILSVISTKINSGKIYDDKIDKRIAKDRYDIIQEFMKKYSIATADILVNFENKFIICNEC